MKHGATGHPSNAVRLPYMPLWVSDIDDSSFCRSLDDADFGRYMRLLIRQWIAGFVPADVEAAIRVAMLDSGGSAAASVKRIFDIKFVANDDPKTPNSVINLRCKEERDRAIARVEQARLNAQKPRKKRMPSGRKAAAKRRLSGRSADAQPTVSVSVSLSDSVSSLPEGCRGTNLDTPDFTRAWSEWTAHRQEIGKPMTDRATGMLIKKLTEMGHDRAIAAIEHSIANGWQGVYEPNRDYSGKPRRDNGDHADERRAAKREREHGDGEIDISDIRRIGA